MGAEAGRSVAVGPRKKRWGTWEELILAGAVTRHGSQDWNVVASELRTRTLRPHLYTPQACKAKYDDVMKRYSSSYDWYDELREVRMAELRRDLEKSDCSIRSLESKIRSLQKKPSNKPGFGPNKTGSPAPVMRSDGNKDGITSWPLDHQAPANEIKQENENSESVGQIKGLSIGKKREGGTLKRQRGKRRRKDCSVEAKEGGIGKSDKLGSNVVISNSMYKETPTSNCDQIQPVNDVLIGIFNSISEQRVAYVFRHRLDGQKRSRYKKIIKQHMDFKTIRSKLSTGSIKSAKDLFRDLLLLANNALVFYSKRTKEYKSGVALRDIVLKAYQAHCPNKATSSASSFPITSSLYNPPGKPRSARPRPCRPKVSASKLDNARNIAASETSLKVEPKISAKSANAKNNAASTTKPSVVDQNDSLQPLSMAAKKSLKSPAKMKNGPSKPRGRNLPGKMDRRRGQQK